MDFLIGGEGTCRCEGMCRGKNQCIGKVVTMLDQTSPSVSSNHRSIRWGNSCFLEVPNRYTRLIPGVDAKDGKLGMTKKGFIDRHVARGGCVRVEEKTECHLLRWEDREGRARVASVPWFATERT